MTNKKINKRKKGKIGENHVRDQFRLEGYDTWNPIPSMYNSNDIYGLFDGIAWCSEHVIFYQVKSNLTHVSVAKHAIEDFIKENGYPKYVHVQIHLVIFDPQFMYKVKQVRVWSYVNSVDKWIEIF